MPTSEARILANKKNAARSTGPKTLEGKERSRANALKHGLSGQGVVLPQEIRDAVEIRREALAAELNPQTVMGEVMVQQMATLSIRMERGAKQECAAIARNVRHAVEDFDDARFEQAEQLFLTLAENPRMHLRKLKRTPEGVERLIEAWEDLQAELTRPDSPNWTVHHLETAVNLLGRRIDTAQGSPMARLSRAIGGDFTALTELEGGHLDRDARKAWARQALVEQIDAEIAELTEHYETLDFETIEKDRAEAGDRALFDPSKDACLARRYEAEASRGFYRAYHELQRVEAEAAAQAEAQAEQAPAPEPEAAPTREPLGSFRETPATRVRDDRKSSGWGAHLAEEPVRDRSGNPLTIARPAPVLA